MAVQTSMQFTVGSTLSRAETQGRAVDILVEGQWLSGTVAAIDSMGVLLEDEGAEPWTIRLDRVSVVRMRPMTAAATHPDPLSAPEAAQLVGAGTPAYAADCA
jgi:hypothetical protein